MKHSAGLLIALIGTWLALSGHYTALLLGLGALSVGLVAWLVHRMELVDQEMVPLKVSARLPLYWLWLGFEILKSSIDVLLRIVRGPEALQPLIGTIPNQQPSELGKTILANSITLTPGTLAVHVSDSEIEIHTVHGDLLDSLAAGPMPARVRRLQTREPAE